MTKNPFVFPVVPVSDNIIVERLVIKTKQQKGAEKSNIILSNANSDPKNIMDIERQKAEKIATYEDAEGKLLSMWDEHPGQGIVRAVGPGRNLEEDVKIPIGVKKGDHVYFRANAGEPIIVNKKLYWVIKEHEIYGKYQKNT